LNYKNCYINSKNVIWIWKLIFQFLFYFSNSMNCYVTSKIIIWNKKLRLQFWHCYVNSQILILTWKLTFQFWKKIHLNLKSFNFNSHNYYLNLKIDISILNFLIWIWKLLLKSENWYLTSEICCLNLEIDISILLIII
jgi:hypothetical protein